MALIPVLGIRPHSALPRVFTVLDETGLPSVVASAPVISCASLGPYRTAACGVTSYLSVSDGLLQQGLAAQPKCAQSAAWLLSARRTVPAAALCQGLFVHMWSSRLPAAQSTELQVLFWPSETTTCKTIDAESWNCTLISSCGQLKGIQVFTCQIFSKARAQQ